MTGDLGSTVDEELDAIARPAAGAASEGRPSFGLPELEPAKTYNRRYFIAKETPETERLTEALWRGLDAADGLDILVQGQDRGAWETVEDRADFPGLARTESELMVGEPDAQQPIHGDYPGEGEHVELARDGVPSMGLRVRMHPQGGYLSTAPVDPNAATPEIPAPYIAPGCTDLVTANFSVDYAEGCGLEQRDDGEGLFKADATIEFSTGQRIRMVTVILYSAEGNALVLTSPVPATPSTTAIRPTPS